MYLSLIEPLNTCVKILLAGLEFLHNQVGLGWGLSILVLTLILRLAIFPLAYKSYASMRGLQKIAPELKILQEKYKDDRERLSQETIKMYSEHKVNPFGSCLPLLAQMPFLISFYYLVKDDLRIEICKQKLLACSDPSFSGQYTEQVKFWGITDITAQATGGLLILLMAIYIVSQIASMMVNMNPTVDPKMKRLFIFMPFLFALMLLPLKPAAGLFIYWIATNIFTLFQQWGLRRYFGDHHPPADILESGEQAVAAAGVRTPESNASTYKAPPLPPSKQGRKRSGKRR